MLLKHTSRPLVPLCLFTLVAVGLIRHDLHEIGRRHEGRDLPPVSLSRPAWSPAMPMEPGQQSPRAREAQTTRNARVRQVAWDTEAVRARESVRLAEAIRVTQARGSEWTRQVAQSAQSPSTPQAQAMQEQARQAMEAARVAQLNHYQQLAAATHAAQAAQARLAQTGQTTRQAAQAAPPERGVETSPNTITLEKVYALHVGMGASEVVRIIGTDFMTNARSRSSHQPLRYTWKNPDGSYLYVDFDNGFMQGATYSGLKTQV